MVNLVWHTKFGIHLDLTLDDLGHPNLPNLWSIVYDTDRLYAARDIPVRERDLQCGDICQEAGVTAWMYLRQCADGRREAVHERAEDEERHTVPMTAEHRAYQERIVRAAETGGFSADYEVRTRTGRRGWIQTDTLVRGESELRIGWEVQLSSADTHGPRSVRSRATKAARHGITPAWHTDRADYARRHDTRVSRATNFGVGEIVTGISGGCHGLQAGEESGVPRSGAGEAGSPPGGPASVRGVARAASRRWRISELRDRRSAAARAVTRSCRSAGIRSEKRIMTLCWRHGDTQ
nr:hypothetical protein [Streptomyces sp. NBC_01549]